ncbi:histidine--tRNA ligase [Elusimicrobiota bacterium]
MEKIKTIKGIRDILYPESALWSKIISRVDNIFESYGYRKIFLPVIEYTELFTRSIGEDTDIVAKEMYSFQDRKGRNLSLRPEGTAGVVRAMIQNQLLQGNIREKVYYFGPMFRYERPQTGRYRQFYQLGCEVFGSRDETQDAEIAELAVKIYRECVGEGGKLLINSVGCEREECRPRYRQELRSHFHEHKDDLCDDCKRRLETNVLRILDCKTGLCRDIFQKLTHAKSESRENLCGDCQEYLSHYKSRLKERGYEEDKDYFVDIKLVRGLDYYTGPVFELQAKDGFAVIAGGRYDNLVKQFGGPDVPACGWALGLDRLAALCSHEPESKKIPEVYLVYLENVTDLKEVGEIFNPSVGMDNAREEHILLCRELAAKLREKGISVEENYEGGLLGKKLSVANRKKIQWVLIYGVDQAENRTVSIKNMKTSEQDDVSIEDIDEIVKRIKC